MTEKPPRRKRRKARERKQPGRPAYKPKLEARQTVEELKFVGEPDVAIARALDIDVDTLRKHFADELADGHSHRRKEVIGLLFKSARDGNVAAQKKLEEMGKAAGAAEAINRRGRRTPAPEEAKLGKKGEQQLAATRIGGKFAPPEPPKLVVDNR